MALDGRVALITGASGAIGSAIAARLARDGAHTVIADLRLDAAREVAESINRSSRSKARAIALQVDVARSAEVDRIVAETVREFGTLDIVVNNAGTHTQALAVHMSDEEWERVQRTNAWSVFYLSRAAMRVMIPRRSGSIINIITGLFGVAYSSAYTSSKFAVWGFSQCLTLEAAPYGIRVNCVAPGTIPDTGFNRWYREKAQLSGLDYDRFMELALETIPLGRFGQPDDIANTVAFLASPEASYITGQCLEVAGGFAGYAVPIRLQQEPPEPDQPHN